MYKEDLALNNQQWLICYKTQPNQAHEKVSSKYIVCVSFKCAVLCVSVCVSVLNIL